jgi:hypothetical protein
LGVKEDGESSENEESEINQAKETPREDRSGVLDREREDENGDSAANYAAVIRDKSVFCLIEVGVSANMNIMELSREEAASLKIRRATKNSDRESSVVRDREFPGILSGVTTSGGGGLPVSLGKSSKKVNKKKTVGVKSRALKIKNSSSSKNDKDSEDSEDDEDDEAKEDDAEKPAAFAGAKGHASAKIGAVGAVVGAGAVAAAYNFEKVTATAKKIGGFVSSLFGSILDVMDSFKGTVKNITESAKAIKSGGRSDKEKSSSSSTSSSTSSSSGKEKSSSKSSSSKKSKKTKTREFGGDSEEDDEISSEEAVENSQKGVAEEVEGETGEKAGDKAAEKKEREL